MKVAEKTIDNPVLEKKSPVVKEDRLPGRLLSIDVFRAVTMFFMIFVNDVDGVNNGDSFYSVATYILTRSIALLVMGFLHVNLENYNSVAILPKAVWEIFI